MASSNFSAGQRVMLLRGRSPFAAGGSYKVVRALPAESGPIRYRIKSDSEPFERIVDAANLTVQDHG